MSSVLISEISRIKRAFIFHDFISKDIPEFQKKNLIYGFNGSGKTTLTRIFSTLSNGEIDPLFPQNIEFLIRLSDGSKIAQNSNISNLKDQIKIYNQEFIDENFQWKEGQAKPVFYIGKEQKELINELAEHRSKYELARAAYPPIKSHKNDTEKALGEFKTKLARDIENEIKLSRKYRADSLKKDYETYSEEQLKPLDDSELYQTREITTSSNPPPPLSLISLPPVLTKFLSDEVLPILNKAASKDAINEIKEHPLMEAWLRHGYEYHSNHDLKTCLFCNNTIDEKRLQLLSLSFDKAYQAILAEINSLKLTTNKYRSYFEGLVQNFPEQSRFAPVVIASYEAVKNELRETTNQGVIICDTILQLLEEKEKNVSKTYNDDTILKNLITQELSLFFAKSVESANSIIQIHNDYHSDFLKIRDKAFLDIKSHYLATNYDIYNSHLKRVSDAEAALNKATEEGKLLGDKIKEVEGKLKSHALAAEHISRLVNNFMAHKEFSLYPTESGYELRRRDGSLVTNLSEGEKRAITFCYFLSTLEANGKSVKDFIIVIDDPICSLDSKSMNYTCRLIKRYTESARQLFVLTHNLHFMHEMRKWIFSKNKMREAKDKSLPIPLYFIQTKQTSLEEDRHSYIVPLPTLLREYESEYHYLYSVVNLCAISDPPGSESLYLIPNAIRRALEIFMYFKAPGSEGLEQKISNIQERVIAAGKEITEYEALLRLAEGESHSDNLDVFTDLPLMTIEEAKRAAVAFIDLVKILDVDHARQMNKLCGGGAMPPNSISQPVTQPIAMPISV